jgi:transposase
MRRALVSSEKSFEGKLFVQFIALIIISYINNQMKTNNLYRDLTLQGLLDKLDIIECYENDGKKLRVGIVLEKQKMIYEKLDVPIP